MHDQRSQGSAPAVLCAAEQDTVCVGHTAAHEQVTDSNAVYLSAHSTWQELAAVSPCITASLYNSSPVAVLPTCIMSCSNLLGASLTDLCRAATSRHLEEPDEIASQQVRFSFNHLQRSKVPSLCFGSWKLGACKEHLTRLKLAASVRSNGFMF